jgi:hypothetical protein
MRDGVVCMEALQSENVSPGSLVNLRDIASMNHDIENVHPEEAKLLLAIKDQKLNKLYPKITRKLLEAVEILPKMVKAPKE